MFSFSSCRNSDEPIDEATFNLLSTDENFINLVRMSNHMMVFIAYDSINFGKDMGVRHFNALQNAANSVERVEILRAAGCTGYLERFIELETLKIEYGERVKKSYPNLDPKDVKKITTLMCAQIGEKPDYNKIIQQWHDKKRKSEEKTY
jgi:hypothetical protein